MVYKITEYSQNKIKELNEKLKTDAFSIQPSKDKSKKIDVYLFDKVIASIGAIKMSDFPTFLKSDGEEFANKRREAFYARFKRIPNIKDGKILTMFWTRYILW